MSSGRASSARGKARVAVARKIAVILRCIRVDGTEFWRTREEAKAA